MSDSSMVLARTDALIAENLLSKSYEGSPQYAIGFLTMILSDGDAVMSFVEFEFFTDHNEALRAMNVLAGGDGCSRSVLLA